jgi:hypothetical protein
MPSGKRRLQRDSTDRAVGLDVEKNICAIVIPVSLDLQQLKKWQVLFDELLGQPRGLSLWICRIQCPKELNGGRRDAAVVLKLETDFLRRPDGVKRRASRRLVARRSCMPPRS